METRFVVLSLLTSIFQVICGITLVVGIGLIIDGANAHPGMAVANNPFGQGLGRIELGGGAVLALYGLTGLVFSGGINVLISIDQNTHSLSRALPVALAALQKAIAANAPVAVASMPAPQLATPPIVPVATRPTEKQCAKCNSLSDANARFCEHCGEPLASD